MGHSRAEQETLIRWDEAEKVVHIFSASPVTWRKLARLGVRPVKETTRDGDPSGKFYRVPYNAFRWGLKRRQGGDSAPRGFARRNRALGELSGGQNGPEQSAPPV